MALELIDDFNSVSDPGELVRQVLLRAVDGNALRPGHHLLDRG